MKSIVYLCGFWSGSLIPRVIEHAPEFPAFECYRRHDPRWLSPQESTFKYVTTIKGGDSIHEKINTRAELFNRTGASGRRVTPAHYVYPDYCVSSHRIRRAIARHQRRHPKPPGFQTPNPPHDQDPIRQRRSPRRAECPVQ